MAINRGLPIPSPTQPLMGGYLTGCTRAQGEYWPADEVRYAARITTPSGDTLDVVSAKPLRNLLIPGDRIMPAPLSTPCLAIATRGRLNLIVFGEQLEPFECEPPDVQAFADLL